jgi:DNA repair exonuclease SbcCD ATPase subunit
MKKWFLAVMICIAFYSGKIINNPLCTGIYHEMRELEGGEPAAPTGLTAEEEEALLYGSEDDTPPTEEEAEKARKQAEKEAEEADLNAKQAELQERIRRRKAERKQRMEEQMKLEQAAMLAEQERLREEAEAEKAAHRQQIEKLEEQLRLARSGSGQDDEGEDGEEEMDDDRPVYPKRDRSGSDDSRHESTASSSLGANCFNLPAGYKAVRSENSTP